eukprot:TRINITY_DN55643_c0_g1_i1.p1 TRINITY_DN55643_c0_g1~~TRINITY_DN55643_c0_g1_i1.p1  ORF type:complete len:257 (+),score=84.16 TRINITY_DN55643_c0_g1_i1:73-771(+)
MAARRPALAVLAFCVLLACESFAKQQGTKKKKQSAQLPEWRRRVDDPERRKTLQCSACLATLSDVSAHLHMLKESRGGEHGRSAVESFFQDLCPNGESQFWALMWAEDGPARLEYRRRYDIHKEEKAVRQAEESLGIADAEEGTGNDPKAYSGGGYWGSDEQKEWAKGFFLEQCAAVMESLTPALYDFARNQSIPDYPESCPFPCPPPPGSAAAQAAHEAATYGEGAAGDEL